MMNTKRLPTRKQNGKIYTLQKWIRRDQMYPISKPGKEARTHTNKNETR